MKTNDLLIVAKALELLSYGENIESYTKDDIKSTYFNKSGNKITRAVSSVEDFVVEFDEETREKYSFYYNFIKREGSSYSSVYDVEPNLKVSFEMFKGVVFLLFKSGVTTFDDVAEELKDAEYIARMEELERSFDRTAVDCDILKDLKTADTDLDFKTLLAVAYDDVELREKLYQQYTTSPEHFDIKGFEHYPVYDNRLFIAVGEHDKKRFNLDKDIKYIVISHNPYDYFFCSYGNSFQSCFALSSDYSGWYGAVPLSMYKGNYMVYATNGSTMKVAVTRANKMKIPQMFWRQWSWIVEGDGDESLIVDKMYPKEYNSKKNYFKLLEHLGFNTKQNEHRIKYSQELEELRDQYYYHIYWDSMEFDDSNEYWTFTFDNGAKEFQGSKRFSTNSTKLIDVAAAITSVSPTLNISLNLDVVDGTLMNVKVCPVTHLNININETESVYAKLLSHPVDSSLVVTFIDGFYKADASSIKKVTDGSIRYSESYSTEWESSSLELGPDFCRISQRKNIQAVKERLKGFVKTSKYDCIFLRYVNGTKVELFKYM